MLYSPIQVKRIGVDFLQAKVINSVPDITANKIQLTKTINI